MLSLISITTSLLATTVVRPVAAQTFALVCGGAQGYPDVCDNTSNAMFCHGLTGPLHYDATSEVGTGDQRRTAIGCGANNYCRGTGLQCDEYPYASTYDGGLGCYPAGFQGTARLAQSGTTRCADGTQNARHGQALGQFYQNTLHFNNGAAFMVGFQNDARGPLGEAIRTRGQVACPNESTGNYRFRSTPATPACPARGTRIAAEDTESEDAAPVPAITDFLFRNVTTESGRIVTVPYLNDTGAAAAEKMLAVGQPIWTHDEHGNGVEEKIVSSNLM